MGKAIGKYIKDTYGFVDEKIINAIDMEKPEPLGIWGKGYILTKAETPIYLSSYSVGGGGWQENILILFLYGIQILENGRISITQDRIL
ncbi:hypothetical protein C5E26_00785 [Pectobacterium parmentieri]|nr:hypothetical protein C5E26_00785 [Pectobacterium parmentieri]AYH25861.1 hypothetical protein C5E20_00990 [Pectobacterium parmentieri]